LYAGRGSGFDYADVEAGRVPWLAIDDAIPDHPSVAWRKRHFPKVMPTYFVNSLQIVAEMVAMGMGVAILPVLMAQGRSDLVPLRDLTDANQSELWLLTHPESRHLRRIAVVYGHLAQVLRLP
jgi:DNA-binding transcriptional LysR family regulator